MTASIIYFSDFRGLSVETLAVLAMRTARDIDAGANKHALLDRIMRAVVARSYSTAIAQT